MSTLQIALIPLLPLATFVVLGLFGRKYLSRISGMLGTLSLLISCVLSISTACSYFFVDGMVDGKYQMIQAFIFTWLEFSPGISIDMGLLLDPISVMMLVVVTFVSLMVHVFSLGYMKGEERFATYYAFLSLFTFSMLGLVLSTNIFQIYMFWELVGVSSFLLIGYYFDKPSAVAASKKAFIVTRFADLGFLVGILILGFQAETLDFGTLIARLSDSTTPFYQNAQAWSFVGLSALTWGLLLVFMGGAGKSAMFPFHIWLPDAMEGPTPVSALIHAATMVVAGVFLVARLFPLYVVDGISLQVVMVVGVFSALLAAVIACTQTDIKRVLAYSTMSQIGYMMFSLGVSGAGGEYGLGYMASMFHLFTHAFFKSLLFLGAGAVIHLVHSNEMKDMGGLRKLMPITHGVFLVACLAIAGIPPFAGFFSKEEILLAAYQSNVWVYVIGLFVSGLTAFYMFRLYFMIFWNKESHAHAEHGEATMSMKIPLLILGACSLLAGFVPISNYITADGLPLETHIHLAFSVLPVTMALLGIGGAWILYHTENEKHQAVAQTLGGLYQAAYKKFYMDEVYVFITKRIVFNLIGRPAAWIDRNIVDGFMNRTAQFIALLSEMIKGVQSGQFQQYTAIVFASIIGFVILFIYLWP
ncbi:MAG: NADH-quinone oxidoreductase subunit L [Bacteroidia bacterium]|jgi:NADH-quinone oxidoreductase subunit L